MGGRREDPLTGYHYTLEIDGITKAIFREATGLGSEQQVIDYKDSDKKGQTIYRKIPGTLKWPDLTLKKGIVGGEMELWEWRKLVEDGYVDKARKNGSVVMFKQDNTEFARFNFLLGWPSKISGPQLNANNNDIAMEEITIAHEGLTRVK
jgi:phage tail-like protein